MLVNLIGPPACGKTTFAKRFVSEFPSFLHLSIDQYRIDLRDELEAWYVLIQDAIEAEHCIVESSGASSKLPFLLEDLSVQRRGICTIHICGASDILLQRAAKRAEEQTEEIPFEYSNITIEGLIKKHHDIVAGRYPLAYRINSTIPTNNRDVLYMLVREEILKQKKQIEAAIQ